MDFIVSLFRALANTNRLRLLRCVHAHPTLTVSDLARRSQLRLNVVSQHLKLLADFGLVTTRPAGRTVYVQAPPASARRHPLIRTMNQLLRDTWHNSGNRNSTLREVWNFVAGGDGGCRAGWEETFARMAWVFTAYTHLRRLLILRELAQQGGMGERELAERLGMSDPAAGRQLDKLRRRGLIARTGQRGQRMVDLAPASKAPLQRRLHQAVMRALAPDE